MFEFIQKHQLEMMQALSGICGVSTVLLLVTRALSVRRRVILILMQLTAMFLLVFDRFAYIYAGDLSRQGYIMVRLSNLIVFFLTPAVVLVFDLYLMDLLTDEGGLPEPPRRLKLVALISCLGMFLALINYFTGLYYIIDEQNRYHRSKGFLICYIIPILGPLIQFSVIVKHHERFSRIIRASLYIYLIAPVVASVIQIFAYGISLTNTVIVLVSVIMYVFAYFDINNAIEKAHKDETSHLRQDRRAIRHLYDQTVRAFMTALDDRDAYSKGRSVRVADYARMLAEESGLSKKESDEVYFEALVHDIGKIGISENVLIHEDEPDEEELKILRQKPEIGSRILSSITEFPGLDTGAKYCNERYDGSGYPGGLKGDDIPRNARIIAVADEYDRMTSRRSFRDPLPQPVVREELTMASGLTLDPVYTQIMLRKIDADGAYNMREEGTIQKKETTKELHCREYRDAITEGILIEDTVKKVTFKFREEKQKADDFADPSLIIFDSYDALVHNNDRTIGAYAYKEYAELWFDGHYISTLAENMKVTERGKAKGLDKSEFRIEMGRYQDHLRLRLESRFGCVEAIIALTDRVSWAYVGITGENCHIYDIKTEKTSDTIGENDIERIADEKSYIDRFESDIPNIQVNGTRSVSTPGIPVKDGLKLMFHTMSLPVATLVWHCPYIVVFYSEDGLINGPGYTEYALIKLNGEDNGSKDYVTNSFTMKKTDDFRDWNTWKEKNRIGFEVEVDFARRGRKISLSTQNLGISIHNAMTILDDHDDIYVALTGDQVALTDIRVS